MIVLIAIIILAMLVWAIFPPVAVGLILVVGGGWLLVAGLCRVSGTTPELHELRDEEEYEDLHKWTAKDVAEFERYAKTGESDTRRPFDQDIE